MILFKATPRQVLQIVANAVNASYLASINDTHDPFNNKVYIHEDFKLQGGGIDLKTFGGRMVELAITHDRHKGHWKVAAGKAEPDPDYQSWADEYTTYRALVESVEGVEVLEEDLEEENDE